MALATNHNRTKVCALVLAALCLVATCSAAVAQAQPRTLDTSTDNAAILTDVDALADTQRRDLAAAQELDLSLENAVDKDIDVGEDTKRRELTGNGGGGFFYQYRNYKCYSNCCKYYFGRYWFGDDYSYGGGYGNGYRGGNGNKYYYYHGRNYYCYWNCCKYYFNRYYPNHHD